MCWYGGEGGEGVTPHVLYFLGRKLKVNVSQPRGVELGHLWESKKKKKKKSGKGAERSYLVCMLKGIILSPWVSAPATNTQTTFFSLLNRHLIVLFQLEAVVGE